MQVCSAILALVVLALAVYRIVVPPSAVDRIDLVTLAYLAAVAGLSFLASGAVTEIGIPGFLSVKLREIEAEAVAARRSSEDAKALAREASSLAVAGGTVPHPKSPPRPSGVDRVEGGEDPQKGRWGGTPRHAPYELTARVSLTPSGYFGVNLVVRRTDGNWDFGPTTFHLHPTFGEAQRVVYPRGGKAELSLVCYGSFTVGAEVDGRKLELDLAEAQPRDVLDVSGLSSADLQRFRTT